MVALLIAGGAISLLISCGGPSGGGGQSDEAIISRTVRDMEVVSSENGKKSNLLRSPLVEEHAFAKDAYEEHPRGIEVIGYDSIDRPSSRVIADHALHWTARDLWELKGNVLVEGDQGQKLYTQQLYWDRKIKKIYSNVDSKVEQAGDVFIGEGFEADDDFSRWTFRRLTGTVGVNVRPASDSTGVATPTDVNNPPSLLSRPTPLAPPEPYEPEPEPSDTPAPAPEAVPVPMLVPVDAPAPEPADEPAAAPDPDPDPEPMPLTDTITVDR